MDETMNTTQNIALLAPVPLIHLESGWEKLQRERADGLMAFGSQKFELFRRLDKERNHRPVDVYIYASHADGHRDFEVTWHAYYVNSVECDGGVHPHGMEYRPATTITDTDFGVFWEVRGLRRIEKPIPLTRYSIPW